MPHRIIARACPAATSEAWVPYRRIASQSPAAQRMVTFTPSVLGVDRSSVRYRSVRPDDADLRKAMKAVAAARRRFGYRRVHAMLERQGWRVPQKMLRRRL